VDAALSSKDGELVAQDEDLDLLGGVGSGVQHHPTQELGQHQVDQPQRHRRIIPVARSDESAGQGLLAQFRSPTGAEPGVLTGMATSPGVAEGPARVVASPAQIDQVRDGEILVAPLTAPSWDRSSERSGPP
jgi:hypothetical protein